MADNSQTEMTRPGSVQPACSAPSITKKHRRSSPVDVIHEEIITHPDAVQHVNGWRGEARVMGIVKIGDRTYEFDQVVSLRLRDPDDE